MRIEYLEKTDFILINRMTVEQHGGSYVEPFNFLHENPLDYLVDAAKAEMFGQPLYPKISDLAGLYMFNIISNHVFQDGNKRTGLASANLFLKLNGFQIIEKLGKENLDFRYDFTMSVASGKVSLEECQTWFEENVVEMKG